MPAPVIVVSLDGFRHSYLRLLPPSSALRTLARDGATAGRMLAVNPSKTFPSHWSIATGVPPDEHGLFDNYFYAADGVRFAMSEPTAHDARWWQGAEPIWAVAERQGLPTAPAYWPGADVAFRGARPTFRAPRNRANPRGPVAPPFRSQVRRLLRLLSLPPHRRPALLTAYYDGVDVAGHSSGPESAPTRRAVRRADAAVGALVDALRAAGHLDDVNVVLVSDHGMQAPREDCMLDLDETVPPSTLARIDFAPPAEHLATGVAGAFIRPARGVAGDFAEIDRPTDRAAALREMADAVRGWSERRRVADSASFSARRQPDAELLPWPDGANLDDAEAARLVLGCGCLARLRPRSPSPPSPPVPRGGLWPAAYLLPPLPLPLPWVAPASWGPVGPLAPQPRPPPPWAWRPAATWQLSSAIVGFPAADASATATAGAPRGGQHGYVPGRCGASFDHSMDAIFIGHGPAFRPGSRVPTLPIVHVHRLLAHALSVAPATRSAGGAGEDRRTFRDAARVLLRDVR